MAYEAKGRVKSVGAVQQVTEKFAKRELIIEVDGKYPQVLKFETSGDRNALLDGISHGDSVTIQFDLRGREGRDGKVWNTLSIWKIQRDGASASAPAQPQQSWGNRDDDPVPF